MVERRVVLGFHAPLFLSVAPRRLCPWRNDSAFQFAILSQPPQGAAMNPGELRFYLREVQSHWSTGKLSSETMAELLRQELIERSEDGLTIRLTNEGKRQKLAGRQRKSNSSLNLVRTPERPPRPRQLGSRE